MEQSEVVDSPSSDAVERRRDLLPTWIKIFLWIFMVLGAIIPVALVFGLLGYEFELSLYGMESMNPLSRLGMFIIMLFAIKGAVSFGLWTEKDWAVKLATFDAIIGIVISATVMLVLPFYLPNGGDVDINIQLDLFVLIPYLITMRKIAPDWKKREE
jgi:hypothetical protein